MRPDESKKQSIGVLPIDTPGGAEGIRTPDLLRAKEALSQLSYSPMSGLYQLVHGAAICLDSYLLYYSFPMTSLTINQPATRSSSTAKNILSILILA
jgi:hypothetical protein